jgi:MFS family permease
VTADRQLPIILALGTTQTLAWESSYYLPAILADPIARDLGISSNWFFAAFSASLVISGLLGPRVGRQIDLVGGRQVLSASNIILAAGLALLGASTSLWMLAGAWLLLGIGIGMGLGLTTLRSARWAASTATTRGGRSPG